MEVLPLLTIIVARHKQLTIEELQHLRGKLIALEEQLSNVVAEEEDNIGKEQEEGIILDLDENVVGKAPQSIGYLIIQLYREEESEQQYESFLFDVQSKCPKRMM